MNKGRPVIDSEWNAVISTSSIVLPHEEEDNQSLVEEWKLSGALPHGCKIRPGQQSKALGNVWLCQMYLGGKQRVIGTGTLHQCSRLYDAALVTFEKYRSHPTTDLYNISREQAISDIEIETQLSEYLDDLEKVLLERKLVTTALQRKNIQELREVDRKHSRTAAGRTERGLHLLADQIDSIKISISTLDSLIRSSALTLAAIQSLLQSQTQTQTKTAPIGVSPNHNDHTRNYL